MKLDPAEKELVGSVERGEWKSAKSGKRARARYRRYAKAVARRGEFGISTAGKRPKRRRPE